jgi:hypothetical protein
MTRGDDSRLIITFTLLFTSQTTELELKEEIDAFLDSLDIDVSPPDDTADIDAPAATGLFFEEKKPEDILAAVKSPEDIVSADHVFVGEVQHDRRLTKDQQVSDVSKGGLRKLAQECARDKKVNSVQVLHRWRL